MAVDVDTSQLKQDFRIIARKKPKGGRMSLRAFRPSWRHFKLILD